MNSFIVNTWGEDGALESAASGHGLITIQRCSQTSRNREYQGLDGWDTTDISHYRAVTCIIHIPGALHGFIDSNSDHSIVLDSKPVKIVVVVSI